MYLWFILAIVLYQMVTLSSFLYRAAKAVKEELLCKVVWYSTLSILTTLAICLTMLGYKLS